MCCPTLLRGPQCGASALGRSWSLQLIPLTAFGARRHKLYISWCGEDPRRSVSQGRVKPGSLWDAEMIDSVSVTPMEPPETDLPLSINWRNIQTLNPHDSNSSSVT